MNKDLDNRLIPNGEYRDAQNISVGKSESDSIGSLENVLGNKALGLGQAVTAGNIIGTYNDEPNQLIYAFFSDNTSDNLISTSSNHYIVVLKTDGTNFSSGNPWNILVQGKFLNFSTSFPIIGINLIEDLLFFTDNRNQPRVINVNNTLGYYTQESDLSVAKFSPFEPIQLFKEAQTTSTSTQTSAVVAVAVATGIEIGMTLISTSSVGIAKIQANDYVKVVSINGLNITLSSSQAFSTGDLLYFASTTMTNEDSNTSWPGDPNFLTDKFVRFSYRFRYADGEYSTFAPFTQPTYIPRQDGYFLNENEENAYRSTILSWMENKVQNVELLIPLPDIGNNIDPRNSSPGTYKILELDILYKESDGLVAKVLDTVSFNEIINNSPTTNIFSYNYQSSKPYKTLTEAQTIRVYDQIPVRALAQESSGNRIIYGNFYNKFSPPTNGIKYEVGVSQKRTTPNVNNWIEYPNSSLKQNRNYQVGIVLADKFGRQSSVILSNVINSSRTIDNIKFGGSTIFSAYNNSSESTTSPIKDWFGDALQVFFDEPISTGTTSGSYLSGPVSLPNTSPVQIGSDPGLYAQVKGNNSGFDVKTFASVSQKVYTFNLTGSTTGVPSVGDYLRGEFTDYVKVTNVTTGSTTGTSEIGGSGTSIFLTTLNTSIVPNMIVSGFGGGVTSVVVSNVNVAGKSVIVVTNTVTTTIGMVLTFGEGFYSVTCDGDINVNIYSPNVPAATTDAKFAYQLNQAGWYSYKIVVKQQEQDYYNAFLPGILNGYPDQKTSGVTPIPTPFPVDEINETANIVLLNDNINKIPRDLEEVGPDQKQFSSSVQLFGRVENTATSNVQYFPGTLSDTAINIETADDSNMAPATLTTTGVENLYQLDTNPLVARISTSKEIGVSTSTMVPHLAIYETEPVESVLDIYWESTTTGLISDLNADILSGFDGATGFSSFVYSQTEAMSIETILCSQDWKPTDSSGGQINAILSNFTATNANGDPVAIELVKPSTINPPYVPASTVENGVGPSNYTGPWNLRTTALFTYDNPGAGSIRFSDNEYFQFSMDFDGTPQSFKGDFTNIAPVIDTASLLGLTTSVGTTSVLRVLTGKNGSIDTTNDTESLFFDITAQADANANAVTHFTLTGAGSLTMTGSTPSGSYVLTIRLRDATPTSGGSLTPGFKQVTGTLNVTVGNAGLSPGCISPCIDPSTTGAFATNTVSATTYNVKYNACWYISDTTLTNSDFTSTGFPGTNTVVSANNGAPWHLGPINGSQTDQKNGTIVFNITLSQRRTQTSLSGSFLDSAVESFNVYSRAAVQSGTPNAWVPATDINGFTFLGTTASPDQLSMFVNNPNANTYLYNQYVFAFKTPEVGGNTVDTEYAIVMIGLEMNQPDYIPVSAELPIVTVNSQDLYNDSCVLIPKSGTNPSVNYGTLNVATPKSYQHSVGQPNATLLNNPGGGDAGTGGVLLFAPTAYANYVQEFYSDLALTTPSDWSVTSPGGSAYNGSSPVYPWNVDSVPTQLSPLQYSPVTYYKDYNFASVFTKLPNENRYVVDTSVNAPYTANYRNNSGFPPPAGVTQPLLIKTGGASS